MIALDPSGYVRQPWKNGGGVSEEIAARREGEGWEALVWSFSRTGFAGPSHFSDLKGFDRRLMLVRGTGLSLRAWDDGPDIAVAPNEIVGFDGGRVLEGVPDGPVDVVNLMGRSDRVRIAMTVAEDEFGDWYRFRADIVLVHAAWGRVGLQHDLALPRHWTDAGDAHGEPWEDHMANGIPDACTLLFDEGNADLYVMGGRAVVATVTLAAR